MNAAQHLTTFETPPGRRHEDAPRHQDADYICSDCGGSGGDFEDMCTTCFGAGVEETPGDDDERLVEDDQQEVCS